MQVSTNLVVRPLCNFLLASALFILGCSLPSLSANGTAAPKSVVDYYMLLPNDYFEIPVASRKDLLDGQGGGIVDVSHGYLLAQGDGAQPTLEVALFKKKSGGYLAAVAHNEDDVASQFLDFFEYNGGKLIKIKSPLPVKLDERLSYKLPRTGTTILIRNAKGTVVKKLQWNGTSFKAL